MEVEMPNYRRPFRPRRPARGLRRLDRLPPGVRKPLIRLRRAHNLMEQGKFKQAGAIFDDLATGAENRGLPRASQLKLQAGRCWLLAGKTEQGLNRLKDGLGLMVAYGQTDRLDTVSQRILGDLKGNGFEEEAKQLEVSIRDLLSKAQQSGVSTRTQKSLPILPSICPKCGASIHPEEVEWINNWQAICDYCGSILQAKG